MSNEFGGRGRGTKRKVEQNSSTSSKKPRGELQTPALPGDAWVLMPNNLIRLYCIFRIFATQLLCILSYACLFESFYNTLFCNFWSDRLTSPEDGHFVTRLQLYSESSNISIQHNLILFEKNFTSGKKVPPTCLLESSENIFSILTLRNWYNMDREIGKFWQKSSLSIFVLFLTYLFHQNWINFWSIS